MKKRAQFELSFSMIFSIILIVIFIAFSVYAIQKFLDVQNSTMVGKFATDFQTDIDKIWQSSKGAQEKVYSLPKKISYVCFIDYSNSAKGQYLSFYKELEQNYYENENLFFYPVGSSQGLNAKSIKNIDLQKTTIEENPNCFENKEGKIAFMIKKEFDESLVTIEK